MPLALTAQRDNTIVIDTGNGVIRIEMTRLDRRSARLSIAAPKWMSIWREDRDLPPPGPDPMERDNP